MSKVVWDATGEKTYETGVDHGVLYPYNAESSKYTPGVAWNGLTAITESPSGAEPNDLFADNIKYLTMRSAEDFGYTIEAYTYPDAFMECDGSANILKGISIGQQSRKSFGFSYRSAVGNDVAGNDYGYKLHLFYGCTASPSEKGYQTINDSPDAITFSWEVSTTPVNVDIEGKDYKPTSYVIIDSTKLDAAGKEKLKKLEDALYGTESEEAYLPLPGEVYKMFSAV